MNRIATIIALLLSLGLTACEVDTQPMPDDGGWGEGEEDGDITETGPPMVYLGSELLGCCVCLDGEAICIEITDPFALECDDLAWSTQQSATNATCYQVNGDLVCEFTCD